MFTRVVEVNLKSGKNRELSTILNEKVLPMLKSQPGFVDEITLISESNPNHLLALSFWKNKEDAERYQRDTFPKVQETIRPMIDGSPTVQTFTVDTSTTHRIAAGRAA